MTNRRAFLRGLTAGGLTLLAGCTGGNSAGSGAQVVETSSISMSNSQFDPRNVHTDAGATVTWTNDDATEHTVTSASNNWNKDAAVPAGETTTYTFEESDVYDVYCSYHGGADLSGMSMKIAVGDASINEPLGGGSEGDSGGY